MQRHGWTLLFHDGVILQGMSCARAIRLEQLIAIGGGQRSAVDFGYSFATTRSPGLSSMRGLTTKTPYGPQAASQILTPCSKRGWGVATLLMTGMH